MPILKPLSCSERVEAIGRYLLDASGSSWTPAAHQLASEQAHIFAAFVSILAEHAPTAASFTDYRLWLQSDRDEGDEDAFQIFHALLDCRAAGRTYALPERFCQEFINGKLRLEDGLRLMAAEDKSGRSARSLALANKNTKNWAKTYGTYLNRYNIAEGPPVHESKTCAVHLATDVRSNKLVALKIMREKEQYDREIKARTVNDGKSLLGCLELLDRKTEADRRLLDKQKCLVMPRGSRSLFEAINTERFAGRDLNKVREISYQLALALQGLHESKRIHGDIKPRNAVRTSKSSANTFIDNDEGGQMVSKRWRESPTGEGLNRQEEWKLIDLDASVEFETEVSEKASTGYVAPEVARSIFDGAKKPKGHASQDIWGFGALLYQLLSGTKLFMVDESDDNLVHNGDKLELMNWLALDEERMGRIKLRPESGEPVNENGRVGTVEDGLRGSEDDIEAARDLVRLCLRGKPDERISLDDLLHHPFFDEILASESEPSSQIEENLGSRESGNRRRSSRRSSHKEKYPKWYHEPALSNELTALPTYHFFLSHMQQQAAGIVKDLAAGLERNQMTAWVDMRAAEITLETMQRGVLASQCFVMVLTTDVLFRPFCLAELKFAVDHFRDMGRPLDKHIFFFAEEDGRFSQWQAIEDEPWTWDDTGNGDVKTLQVQAKAETDKAATLQDLANETDDENIVKIYQDEAVKVRQKAKEYRCRIARRNLEKDLSGHLFRTSVGGADEHEESEVKYADNYKKYFEAAQEALKVCRIIPYRRRHFEEEAMIRKLATLAGFHTREPEEPRRVPSMCVIGKEDSSVVAELKRQLGSDSSIEEARVIIVVLEPGCCSAVHAALGIQPASGDEGANLLEESADHEASGTIADGDNQLLEGKHFLAVENDWNFRGKEKERFHEDLQKKIFDHLEVLSWRKQEVDLSAQTRLLTDKGKKTPPRKYTKEHELESLIVELQLRAHSLVPSIDE
ncbi:Protein kinase, putative [Hondaea fermentalgiana]|uniref:Protein kinase, putative n=1 Tax=Hondaea fermentalgiana TaxID=2315210 RepID=A0A2R5GNT9_9STRA|nr:Protein kinase, putative [Hondaea fermentalgiana]|eukprot:GBG31969.1 Protein kinase, putative [Hondaea fermentalgiana]